MRTLERDATTQTHALSALRMEERPEPQEPRPTRGCGRRLAAGREAVERRVVAVLDDGVHRLRLLQLEEQLLHGLNGVITAQVYRHLFNLRRETTTQGWFPGGWQQRW